MARTDIATRYDAIVIGAGIGGLFAANFLAKAGAKTLLLERHNEVGGYLQGGWRQGYFFDYGTQSTEFRGAIQPGLEALGIADRLDFRQCHHRFVSSDGLDLDLHTLEDARREFCAAYPESSSGLERYFEFYTEATHVAGLVNLEGIGGMMRTDCAEFMPDYDAYWQTKAYYRRMLELDDVPGWRKARELLGPSRVNRVLAHFGYRNQSALATGIFWHLWCDDYFYNLGGKQHFVDTLAEVFVERGGTLAKEAAVEEILVEGLLVQGVRLANGQIVRADAVISNADLRHTLERLLRAHPAVAEWTRAARETPLSEAFFSVYLATSIPLEELRSALGGAHHTWFFPTHHGLPEPFSTEFHRALPMEISAPVLHDPSLAAEGTPVVLQAFTYFDWMDRWRVKASGERSQDYRHLKRLVEDQLIDNAALLIPDLKERIRFRWSATPHTHLRYTGNQNGVSAAWTWNPRRTMVRLTQQRITTPFENLFCAGHWVLYPGGLLTATLAGKIAADLVLRGRAAGGPDRPGRQGDENV